MAQNPTPELDKDATAGGVVSDIKAGASHLVERGADAASDAMAAGREYVGRIREVGQSYTGRLYETGNRKAEEAAFYAELGYEEVRDWTRDNPVQALGIAAGIGLLFGLVIARR